MRKTFLLLTLFFSATLNAAPKRVVIVVLDQMRPDYIDTYQLPHLKELRSESINFQNATVGHYPTITFISHPVLATGLFPKHLGWIDEIYWDRHKLLSPSQSWHDLSAASPEQLRTVLNKSLPQPTALGLIEKKLGGITLAVGEKDYAVFTMGGVDADIVVTMGSKIKEGPLKGWRGPDGINIPAYIREPEGGRFYIDSRPDYGTKQHLYPLDGNHYVPGTDPAHQGGDVWSTDVALTLMKKEKDWRLLLLTLAGIDKIGHVYGEMDNRSVQKKTKKAPYNLEKVLHIADDQVGRLVNYLKETGQWDETLLVITADHGGISAIKNFYGDKEPDHLVRNSTYAKLEDEELTELSRVAKKWINTEKVERAAFDTSIRLWFKKGMTWDKQKECKHFSKMPGAVAVYSKEQKKDAWGYESCSRYRGPKFPPFLDPIPLLNTMAIEEGPDLVIQLADETGYRVAGDHGGLQEKALRIPMLFRSPDLKPETSDCPVRLVDLLPLVMTQLTISPPAWMDGNRSCLPAQEKPTS